MLLSAAAACAFASGSAISGGIETRGRLSSKMFQYSMSSFFWSLFFAQLEARANSERPAIVSFLTAAFYP